MFLIYPNVWLDKCVILEMLTVVYYLQLCLFTNYVFFHAFYNNKILILKGTDFVFGVFLFLLEQLSRGNPEYLGHERDPGEHGWSSHPLKINILL